MLGIAGLDALGLIHGILGLVSVALGTAMILRRKGGRAHRRIGVAYVACMVALNVTALLIYDLFGRFGPFHWLALLSLGTTMAGFVPAWLRRPLRRAACAQGKPAGWLEMHARFMSWSYAGLMAAFASEIGARVPGVPFVHGVVWPTVFVIGIAAVMIHRRVPELIR